MSKNLFTVSAIAFCLVILIASCSKKPEAYFIYGFVADSLSTNCDLGVNPECKTVLFTNLSKNAKTFKWTYEPCNAANPGECNFGSESPTVTFPNPSVYTMTLIAYAKSGGKTHAYSLKIDTR